MFKFSKLLQWSKQLHHNLSKNFWTVSISQTDSGGIVVLKNNDEILKFPLTWLRDNCQCSDCFDKTAQSRQILLKEFDVNIHPIKHQIVQNYGKPSFHIQWVDNHKSIFEFDWLKDRSFTPDTQKAWLKNVYQTDRIQWSAADYPKTVQKFSFDNIINSEVELLKFLSAVEIYGVAIIENAGPDCNQVQNLAKCIGFLKRTSYGTHYVVKAIPDAKNVAYLPKPLQLHVDLPYYQYSPGVNILHFLVQPENEEEGQNQLVDGLYVCNILKNNYPEIFHRLSKTTVEWSDVSEEAGCKFHHIFRSPVICENQNGEVERINFSQPQRDSHFCVSVEEANQWYKSMQIFSNIIHHTDSCVTFKMKQGNMIVFDNMRILHGRSGFISKRHVLGGYIDWDVFRSRIRILKSKYFLNSHNIRL